MTRELHGLKVKAIALEVPEDANNLIVSGRMLLGQKLSVVGVMDYVYPDLLPPGSWKIIGRADELTVGQKYSVVNLGGMSAYIEIIESKWNRCCSEHGLTNELILCQK